MSPSPSPADLATPPSINGGRVDDEAADVLYHLAVLLRGRERSLADAAIVLNGRRG